LPLQLKEPIVVADYPIVRQGPCRLETKDLVQAQPARHRHVEVVGRGGRPRKASIVVGPVFRLEKRIRGGEVGDRVAPQFLDQPVLMCSVIALDSLTGMMRIPNCAHIRPNCVRGTAPMRRSSSVGRRTYTFFQSV